MRVYTVDAFTDVPFSGNPAAVVLLDEPRSEEWMQRLAAEMNLSETAFLLAEGDAWRLRWFTPMVEVDLCGHATLASAHILDRGEARFLTRSGELVATRRDGMFWLDFPSLPATEAMAPHAMLEALGVSPVWAGRSHFDWLLELDSGDAVRAAAPEFSRLDVPRGVILTARGSDHDFVSRFFCPSVGIDEDPVTGSAHCVLAPYWAERLGHNELVGYQASSRGGLVFVEHRGDRVLLGGRAVTVLGGVLEV